MIKVKEEILVEILEELKYLRQEVLELKKEQELNLKTYNEIGEIIEKRDFLEVAESQESLDKL